MVVQILLKLLSAQVAFEQSLEILQAEPLRRQLEHFLDELHLSAYHHHVHQSPPKRVEIRTYKRQLHLLGLLRVQHYLPAHEVRLALEVRSCGRHLEDVSGQPAQFGLVLVIFCSFVDL